MYNSFSKKLNTILKISTEEAFRLRSSQIYIEHFLLAILKDKNNIVVKTLIDLKINLEQLKEKIELTINHNKLKLTQSNIDEISVHKDADYILSLSFFEAKLNLNSEINVEHLFLSILKNCDSKINKILKNDYQITYGTIHDKLNPILKKDNSKKIIQNQFEDNTGDINFEKNVFESKNKDTELNDNDNDNDKNTPALNLFGTDLTQKAKDGEIDKIIGREKEIERILQILSRRKKNNPILLGAPGVGKTSIAEGLAIKIVEKKVSKFLLNKKIFNLDITSVVAGTKYRGQFEERMKSITNELVRAKNIILFIDEIHTIIGAGGAIGSLDISNILKPVLANGQIQCIGATTLSEYKKHIEKDGALERRFQNVIIEPTSIEQSIKIIDKIKDKYEQHYDLTYTDEAIKACVILSERYITNKLLPDKAIDVLDETGARIHLKNMNFLHSLNDSKKIENISKELAEVKDRKKQVAEEHKFELAMGLHDVEKKLKQKYDVEKKKFSEKYLKNKKIVKEEHIAEVISMITGISVQKITEKEGEKLMKMNKLLNNTIIGQEQAIEKICKAIRRNRSGIKNPNKPICSFLFVGSTGTGKTFLTKELTKILFNNDDKLLRFDMSEFMEKHSISRLIGSPPGYVGYEEGGQLTELVKNKPYSIILFDEIEKAHKDIYNILLQILDEGLLTDNMGRKINFKNTIIIITSNVGSNYIYESTSGVGFSTKENQKNIDDSINNSIKKSIHNFFSSEFINRLDDIIIFNTLSDKSIMKIVKLEIKKFNSRIKSQNIKISLTNSAIEFIVHKGYNKKYGVRALQRIIQKYVEDKLAEEILKQKVKSGHEIQFLYKKNNEELTIKIK